MLVRMLRIGAIQTQAVWRLLQALGKRRRIYHDAIFARSLESLQMLPLATEYDDIGVMAHLLDENLSAELHDLQQRFLSQYSLKPQVFPSATLAEASLIQKLWAWRSADRRTYD